MSSSLSLDVVQMYNEVYYSTSKIDFPSDRSVDLHKSRTLQYTNDSSTKRNEKPSIEQLIKESVNLPTNNKKPIVLHTVVFFENIH